MKDLKAFFEDLATNESLADKFEGVKETSKIVEIARAEGYEFTKKEYNDVMLAMVSGGVNLSQSKRDSIAEVLDTVADGLREGYDLKDLAKAGVVSALSQLATQLMLSK